MLKSFCFVSLVILIAFSSVSAQHPKVIVSSDDWTFTDTAFSQAPDTDVFVLNVAEYLTGTSGWIHAYTTHWGVTQSMLAFTLASAGYTYTHGDDFELTPSSLASYDALIMTMTDLSAAELQALHDFVDAGGGLYTYGGISTNSTPVADNINPVIAPYGVHMESYLNSLYGVVDVTSATDPIFAGVSGLYQNKGNQLSGSWIQVELGLPGEGLFAVVRGGTPVESWSWSAIKNLFR